MKIISFEGIEGVGKSTQIKLLTNHFQSTGISYEQFREPGSSDAGEKIRELLLDKSLQLSSSTELLLMFAARTELWVRCLDGPHLLKTAIIDYKLTLVTSDDGVP